MTKIFIYLSLCVSLLGLAKVVSCDEEGIRYHLKWVTKELILPIFLEKMFPNTTKPSSSVEEDDDFMGSGTDEIEYRWFKHPQNSYVDELADEPSVYLYSKAADRAILYIVKYNVSTHEQLATYEPRRTALDDENQIVVEAVNDLFTLAYVDGHSIVVTDSSPNDLVAHCNVSILMPNNNGFLNTINLKLIEKNVNLSIGFAKHHYKHHNQQPGTGRQETRGPTAKIVNHHHHNHFHRSKRSNSPHQRRSLVQVNLDIGPIYIPKAQLSPSNNPELTCSLDLLDFEQNVVIQHYELRKPIDDVLESLKNSHKGDYAAGVRPTHPNYIREGNSSSKLNLSFSTLFYYLAFLSLSSLFLL